MGKLIKIRNMAELLEPRYEHQKTEQEIYELWEKSGYFDPDKLPASATHSAKATRVKKATTGKPAAKKAKPFTIIMPPPNANGSLHLGHAVFITLQDILIRFWRMRGRKALWLPGADHAGFETQVVFDKKLEKEGRNRVSAQGGSASGGEIPREQLFKEIWEFTQSNKKIMEEQLRKLGASCDWSREKFTLDSDIVKVVYETFGKLHKDGLLYRDLRVVNWCPKHKTALSDLEVKHEERMDPLYYIKYGPLTLATVRPETKFGDTALAVNPKDKRYLKYIGKEIEAKGILGTLKFKVVGDEAVDPSFGTGVVKVTPAHDQIDFEIWQRHKKEIPGPKIIIDENGRLTADTGPFTGLKVAEARIKVAEAMQEIGILEKTEVDYKHQVSVCYKCRHILEPMPKMQWFVKTKPLAEKAVKAAEKKEIIFRPENSKKVYLHWLKNIRDWNISRQIVWGIRIPAWYCLSCSEPKINPEVKSKWFLVRHGESLFNKEGITQGQGLDEKNPLTQEGIEHVGRTANFLKSQNVGLIISSDLKRCKMTAEIIAKSTGAEIIFDSGLRERDLGEAQGMPREERNEKYGRELMWGYETASPGGESWKEVEERVWGAFRKIKDTHGRKNVVIVSHGGATMALIKKIKNWSHEQMVESRTLDNAEAFSLDILEKPCLKCGNDFYEQDHDVFDTWFSSGQWPFATLMTTKPGQKDFKTFYPTDVMETGYDILFFWVARMVMLGLYVTGKIPFKNVYLHGLVLDQDKKKMSKSKGNVIDPLGVAEIYGSDALRMALVAGNTAGNDIVISEDKIRGYRNFVTKVWNISRFILMNKPKRNDAKKTGESIAKLTATDKKNLAELKKIKTKVGKHIENYEFHLAAETIYHYVWHNFADKIIENYKPRLNGENKADVSAAYSTLEIILIECLKMLHPFMPFVTEAIFQKLGAGELLMTAEW